jgi:3-mercaptopyruvate sulfurtransferase SseA
MSRDTALVTADWVEQHLDDDNVVLVEVDEDTSAYDKGHIKGAIKLDWTTDLQDQVRRDFVASPTTTPSSSTAATTTGSPPTPTGTSSSTATPTSSCSTVAARSGSSTRAS